MNPAPSQKEHNARLIELAVVEHYNTSIAQMKSSSRKTEIVEMRHVAMYLMDKHVRLKPRQIGARFGKDRTTAMYGIQRAQDLIDTDEAIRNDVTRIEQLYLNSK